jgi:hypothetical protein
MIAPSVRRHGPPVWVPSMLIACAALGGCATSRMLPRPLAAATAEGRSMATEPGLLSVALTGVIVRNGPGSWVSDANWDEYQLTIRNASAQPIDIRSIALSADASPALIESTASHQRLEPRTGAAKRAARDVNTVAATGIGMPALMMAGVLSSGGGNIGAIYAAGVVGAVAIPVGLVGGTVLVVNRHRREHADDRAIERTLQARSYALPQQVPALAELAGSAFFPIAPQASRLIVSYSAAGALRQLSLALPDRNTLPRRSPRPAALQSMSTSHKQTNPGVDPS